MVKQEHDSLVESVDSLLPSLAATAVNLNEASKSLSALIERIDGALQRLNLGVTAWTQVSHGGNDIDRNWSEDLGYGRTGRKSWGLVLRKVEERFEEPDLGQHDEWPFNEAPRELRIRAVKHIPNLLKKLDEASQELVKDLSASIEGTAAIVGALEQAARPQRGIIQRAIKGKTGRQL